MSLGQDDVATFEISTENHGRVVINGEDVSRHVMGVRLDMRARELPRLMLYGDRVQGKITGTGVVEVMGDGDPREQVMNLLASISPAELDQRLAESAGLGESIGSAALRILRDMASHG